MDFSNLPRKTSRFFLTRMKQNKNRSTVNSLSGLEHHGLSVPRPEFILQRTTMTNLTLPGGYSIGVLLTAVATLMHAVRDRFLFVRG